MGTTTSTAAAGTPVKILPVPTSNLGTRKAFTTQFGNNVQGLFITWGNEISSAAGDAASAEMQVDLDFHWYNNAIDSLPALGNPNTVTTTPHDFVFEIFVLNPDVSTYFLILRDSWKGTLTVTAAAGTPYTLTVKWAAPSPTPTDKRDLLDGACKDSLITTGKKDEEVKEMNGGAALDGAT